MDLPLAPPQFSLLPDRHWTERELISFLSKAYQLAKPDWARLAAVAIEPAPPIVSLKREFLGDRRRLPVILDRSWKMTRDAIAH
ncbi:hypothetical protein [Bradyrhizobium sp. USDA 336]|uniref:hypothetical protein n=1 Tax=Bradyrhizobium sp. USDA 336 TaxID=3156311 RepID=UPI003839048C